MGGDFMSKRKYDISEYCTAREAAHILTLKLGRRIRPGYIHRVPGIQSVPLDKTTKLYLRSDVQNATIRERKKKPREELFCHAHIQEEAHNEETNDQAHDHDNQEK